MTYTADVCDADDKAQIAEPIFKNYGGKTIFDGEIVTLKVFEDNSLLKAELEKDGKGKVMVLDGGGSLRCALLGGNVAELAKANGWEGLVIYGCIRDTQEVIETAVGVKAINTCPRKSIKRNEGQANVTVRFAGVNFVPGHHLYADQEAVVVTEKEV